MAVRKDKKTGLYFFEYHINKGKPNAIRGYSKPIYKTQREAFLAEEEDKEAKMNPYKNERDYTLNDVIKLYLDSLSGLKGQTINKKRQIANKYIYLNTKDEDVLNTVDKLDINKKISDFHIQEFRNWRNQIASLDLEGSYINSKILSLMRNILIVAAKECDLDPRFPDAIKKINAKSKTKAKAYTEDGKEVNSNDVLENHWEKEEFDKFIQVVDDPRYKLIFQTLYHTGLRIGELRALKFAELKEIDGSYYLTIYNTYTDDNIKTGNKKKDLESKLTPVKTFSSRRNVLLDEIISNELLNWKHECMKDLHYHPNNFMFFNGVDKPISYNAIHNAKEKYIKIAGVKHITLHGFRHSRASFLIRNSEPGQIAAIAAMLGHSVEECLNTYVHFYKKDMYRIIETTEEKMNIIWMVVQAGFDEDGRPIIKYVATSKDYLPNGIIHGLPVEFIPEEELSEEDRELLEQIEKEGIGEIEYVSSEEELYEALPWLRDTDDDKTE